MCAHHAQQPMYINIMQCAKRYHPWNVSIICLYQHANMCIYQYANHVHPPICQPCHLPICQTCVQNMPITHDMSHHQHEPSIISLHMNHVIKSNTNGVVSSSIFHVHVPSASIMPIHVSIMHVGASSMPMYNNDYLINDHFSTTCPNV
jgi:hypothetical protein